MKTRQKPSGGGTPDSPQRKLTRVIKVQSEIPEIGRKWKGPEGTGVGTD